MKLEFTERAAARRAFISIPDLYQSEERAAVIVERLNPDARGIFWKFCEEWNTLDANHYGYPTNADEAWHLARPIVWGLSLGGHIEHAAGKLFDYTITWNEEPQARDLSYTMTQTIVTFIKRVAETHPTGSRE
jgi:hypothetical protein